MVSKLVRSNTSRHTWQIVLLSSRTVCTAAWCLRSCALLGNALAFEERAVSTKKSQGSSNGAVRGCGQLSLRVVAVPCSLKRTAQRRKTVVV